MTQRSVIAFLLGLVMLIVCSTRTDAQGTTIQALAIGDSITWWNTTFGGYGPSFETKFENKGLGKAGWRSQPATSPCDAPWAQWIRDYPKVRIDYVVIQDDFRQPTNCTEDAWRAAWQDMVNAAKAKSAFVIVLDGTHPDLSTITGVDIMNYPVPTPDFGDGVHYTPAGYKVYAGNVVDLLDSLIP